MSNKTKGFLMLVPAVALVAYAIINIFGWWTIPIVLIIYLNHWWFDKAYKLLAGDE